MKKLPQKALFAIALLTIPVFAITRSLLQMLVPQVWGYFFLILLAIEQVWIAWLILRIQNLQDSDRHNANRLQLAVAAGEQLQIEKATLESRLKETEESDRLLKDAAETAAHALKNPLTSVNLVLHRLSHEPLTDAGQERLEVARSQITLAVRLMEDWLDCWRLDSGAIEPRLERIDLGEWLPSVARDVVPRAMARRQTIQCSVDPPCPPIVSDSLMLRRVIEELLTNACKYSYSGAEIQAIARWDKQLDKHVIEIRNPGRIGFREQAKIWDRFYRIPDSDLYKQGGTGLGLSLSKRIVSVLSGEISMQSINNVVVFRVVL